MAAAYMWRITPRLKHLQLNFENVEVEYTCPEQFWKSATVE